MLHSAPSSVALDHRAAPVHIPALDGVRGLAILAVLAFHLNGQVQYRFQNRVPADLLTRTVLGISNYGWVGVDLFFVLSGFLITGILIDARLSQNYYVAFYVRRALRIFPIYFGFLAICLLVIPRVLPLSTAGFSSAVDHQWYLWTYTSNIAFAFKGIAFGPLSHFWSLAVEEHFYLLWPFVVRACPTNRLTLVCGLCILVALASRLAFLLAGPHAAAHMLMPCRLDAFAIGGLTAVAVRRLYDARSRQRLALSLFGLCVALTAVVVILPQLGGRYSPIVGVALRYTLFAVASASLIWSAATNSINGVAVRFLSTRALRAMGKYSYGLYVLHVPLIPILYVVLQRLWRGLGWARPSELVAILEFDVFAGTLIIAAAVLSWHLFEKQVLRLKGSFAYRERQPHGAPQSQEALPD